MSRMITLSSYNGEGTPSNFVTEYERPRVLDKNKQYVIGLSEMNMTYSWYNISEFYGNKKIKYSLDSGKTFKELTFTNGNYSYGDMSSYIAEFLSVNDGVEDSPIRLDFDLTSFKVLITLQENTVLDLSNGNFAELIGFDKKIVKETEYGSKLPNITNSIDNIHVHCDLISDSDVDGNTGDVIYVFSTANLTRSYPFERTPCHIGYSRVDRTRTDSICVWITDAYGRNINLNGVYFYSERNINGKEKMRKENSKELGTYIFVDPVTREQIGGGLFDSIFGTAAKQLAKETIKKSAVAALDTGSKKLGEKVGEYVADKIAPTKPVASPVPTTVSTSVPTAVKPNAYGSEHETTTKPGALIKEIKKYSNQDVASKIGQLLGKGIKARINRLL